MKNCMKIFASLLLSISVFGNVTIGFAQYDTDISGESIAELDERQPGQQKKEGKAKAYQFGEFLSENEYAQMMSAEDTFVDVIEKLYRGFLNRDEEIDVADYNLTEEDASACYTALMNDYPDLFYLDHIFDMYLKNDGGVESIVPRYIYNEEETSSIKASIDIEVDKICSGIDPNLNRADIITAVHNYFATNYTYDWEHYPDNTYIRKFTIMSLFIDKTSVCQGFTLGLKYVLNRYNIPCRSVQSKEMGHIWNIVQAKEGSENWYHVDATWDTQLNSQTFLFMSDNKIKTTYGGGDIHRNYEPDGLANDDYFDDLPFRQSYGSAWHIGNYWYYFQIAENGWDSSGKLMRYSYGTGTEEHVTEVQVEPNWVVKDYGTLEAGFSKAVAYNGIIYYNTRDSIMTYNPETGTTAVFADNLQGIIQNERYIYNFALEGDTLIYTVGDDILYNSNDPAEWEEKHYKEYSIRLSYTESKIELMGSKAQVVLGKATGATRLYVAYYDDTGRFLGVHTHAHDGSDEISFDDETIDGYRIIRAFAWNVKDEPVDKSIIKE